MTTIADIEALGIELPSVRAYNFQRRELPGALCNQIAADAMRDELLAVIERLVEQAKSDETIIATLRDMEIEATERAEQAEADLAAARENPEIRVRWTEDGWTNTHPVTLVAETDGCIDWPVSLKVARYQPGGES